MRGGVSMDGYFRKLMAQPRSSKENRKTKKREREKYRMRGTLRSSIANRSIATRCVPKKEEQTKINKTFAFNEHALQYSKTSVGAQIALSLSFLLLFPTAGFCCTCVSGCVCVQGWVRVQTYRNTFFYIRTTNLV